MSNNQKLYNLSYFLQYMKEEGRNPFEILTNEEMKKAFTPFIINRFFSFSKNRKIQWITQLLNRYTFSFYHQPEINFGLMYLLIPKSKKFERLNYIKLAKDKKQNKYPDEICETIRKSNPDYKYVSKTELTEYIDELLNNNPKQLISLLVKSGFSKQEIRKLLPMVKDYIKELKEVKLTKRKLKSLLANCKKPQQKVSNVTQKQHTKSIVDEVL